MKKILTITACCLIIQSSFAQSFFSDLFGQDGKQKKNLLEQLAALKVYDDYLQKGYSIVKKGTGAIGDFKSGDLLQFQHHFDSLKMVSSRIKNYSGLQQIISINQKVISRYHLVTTKIKASNSFSVAELKDYQATCSNFSGAMSSCISDLDMIVTDGKLQLTDDERIRAIDKIQVRISHIAFSFHNYLDRCIGVVDQRQRNQKDINRMKALQGF